MPLRPMPLRAMPLRPTPLRSLHRFAIAAACALSLGLPLLATGESHAAAATKKERSALSKECSAKADAQKLHGKERRAFRSKCKREGAKPAT